MTKNFVVVGFKGGDAAAEQGVTVAIDCSPGGVGAVEWYALVQADLVDVLADNTGAEIVEAPKVWDGERFGDGAGEIERDEQGEWSGTGCYLAVATKLNAEREAA